MVVGLPLSLERRRHASRRARRGRSPRGSRGGCGEAACRSSCTTSASRRAWRSGCGRTTREDSRAAALMLETGCQGETPPRGGARRCRGRGCGGVRTGPCDTRLQTRPAAARAAADCEDHDPRGQDARADRADRGAKGLTGSYLESAYRAATGGWALLNPTHYGARDTTDLEGFLFPATYELYAGVAPALVDEQLQAFQRTFGLRRDCARARAARDPLPAADRRLDGRARGAGPRRPAEDRGGHLQPAAPRDAAGDRRDDLLRDRAGSEGSRPTRAN